MLFFGHTLDPETTPLTVMKMTKALRMLRASKENQYVTCKAVFVTVKPDTDSKSHLAQFRDLYGGSSDLLVLTERGN